jgi:hypothetical protein
MRGAVVIAGLAIAISACSPSATQPASSTTPASSATEVAIPTPDVSNPVGLIAIGHSGLTGEGAAGQFAAAYENSWATGTSPEVNSVYLRLTVERPETEGKVANEAVGGAPAAALSSQATAALQTVPAPALAIIQTLDSDIRCDGTDADNVPKVGRSIADALDVITTASPNTRILVVGQLGRPSPAFVEELVAHDPAVKDALSGTGMCDFYDPDGNLVEANFETLTGIIEAYEAEQARVCEAVPQCRTDGGVRAAYVDEIGNFAPDWNHLNVRGQAAAAELIWPVVVEILGL